MECRSEVVRKSYRVGADGAGRIHADVSMRPTARNLNLNLDLDLDLDPDAGRSPESTWPRRARCLPAAPGIGSVRSRPKLDRTLGFDA